MRVCAIQLCEPPAQHVEPGHHVCHIVSFGLHVADDTSHLEGEITTIHHDSAQPEELTGDDALLGCWADIGAGRGVFDDEQSGQWNMFPLVIQDSVEPTDTANFALYLEVHIVDGFS